MWASAALSQEKIAHARTPERFGEKVFKFLIGKPDEENLIEFQVFRVEVDAFGEEISSKLLFSGIDTDIALDKLLPQMKELLLQAVNETIIFCYYNGDKVYFTKPESEPKIYLRDDRTKD